MKLTKKYSRLSVVMNQFTQALHSGNRRAAKRLIGAVVKVCGAKCPASSINKAKGRVVKNATRCAKRIKNSR